MPLGQQTKIMGIINITPDSFSHDGFLSSSCTPEKILTHIKRLVSDGADFIDIGGESTRPGAQRISIKEELARVISVIRLAAKNIRVPISVDTYKTTVARAALDSGATIVNTQGNNF